MSYYKLFVITLLFALPLSSFATENDSVCTLNGFVKGLGNRRMVFSFYSNKNTYHGDTLRALHGHFLYAIHLKEPTLITILPLRNQAVLFGKQKNKLLLTYSGKYGKRYPLIRSVLLENKNMELSATKRSFNRAHIVNALLNDSMMDIEKMCSRIYLSDTSYRAFIGMHLFSRTRSAPFILKRDSLLEAIYKRQSDSIAQYVIAHPNSYVSANLIWRVRSAEKETKLAAYNALDTAFRHNVNVESFKNRLDHQITEVKYGDAAPEIILPDTSGKPIHLSSIKGRYTLVDFWASWCAPCRKENPTMAACYRKYHKKGLEIYSISLDYKKNAWVSAIRKDRLSWPQVSDMKGWESAAALQYGITRIPANFLLDQNGKVIARNLTDNELTFVLKECLK